MKLVILPALLLLSAMSSLGQTYKTHGFSFPQAHPRLWFSTPARLSQATKWARAHRITCNRQDYACIAFEHVTRGADCSAAIKWAANTDQSARVGGWPPPAGETTPRANGADVMRWSGEKAYLIFDWCYDQWTPAQISSFVRANQTWVTNVDEQCWGGVAGGERHCPDSAPMSNYYHANLRNDLEFGIATYGDNGSGPGSPADNDIDAGIRRWSDFTAAFSRIPHGYGGGVPAEGTDYGVSFGYLIIPFETIELGGRDIFNECDFLREYASYYSIYGTAPSVTMSSVNGGKQTYAMFDYGDNEGTQDHGSIFDTNNFDMYWQDLWNFASNLWDETGNTGQLIRLMYDRVSGYRATGKYYSAFAAEPWFLSVDKSPKAAVDFSTLPLDYYATGIQYAFLRTAWDTSSTAIMLQMGTEGGSHTHEDIGSFSIWRGGYWVDRETTGYSQMIAGSPNFNRGANQGTSSPFAHNVPVFTNVVLGSSGYAMPAPKLSIYPTVYRLESQPGYFYADVDLTDRYLWDRDHAGVYQTGVVGHVEREFVYVRNLETLVVLDRILAKNQIRGGSLAAGRVVTTFINHCETRPVVEDSNHFTCKDGSQAARQTVLVPSAATYRIINERSCPHCSPAVGQYRIEVDNSGAGQRYDLEVIQSRATNSPNITASLVDSDPRDPTSGAFTVTLAPLVGNATRIIFEKSMCKSGLGECSSGGSIDIGGSGPNNLRNTVEPIAYTRNGPVWGGQN